MTKRELSKEEQRQAYYDEPYAWHIRTAPGVYHAAPDCSEGHDLNRYLMADFLDGTGGYPLCAQCEALSR